MDRHVRAVAVAALMAFTAVAPLWLPGTAHACTCDPAAGDPFARADAVFVGTAIEVRRAPAGDPAEYERRYVFDVTDVYKGDVYARQSVVSSFDPDGNDESDGCGLPWDQEGAIAVVYGFRSVGETTLQGELWADSCDTLPLGPTSITESFGAPVAPIDGASPIGIDPVVAGAGGAARFSWEWVALGVLAAVGVAVGVGAPSTRRARLRAGQGDAPRLDS